MFRKNRNRSAHTITSMGLVFGLLLTIGSPTIEALEAMRQDAEQQTAFIESLDLPETIPAHVALEKKHVSISDDYADRPNAIAYENEDGTKTAYFFNSPIKYENANGVMEAIDNDPVFIKNKDLEKGYKYENEAGAVKTYFPKKLSADTPLITDDGIYKMSFYPVTEEKNLTPKEVNVKKKDIDAKPYIEYKKAFGKDTALRYRATGSGIKEDIVLDKYTGQTVFEFIMDTDGLIPENNGGHAIKLLDENGEMQGILTDINMQDASGALNLNNSILTEPVDLENSLYKIIITVDESFLSDPDTTYPVTIDPGYAHMIVSSVPVLEHESNSNLLGAATIQIGLTSKSNDARGYIQFSTPDIDPPPLTIICADYHFYQMSPLSVGRLDAYQNTSTWSPSTITWNNKPGHSTPAVSSVNYSGPGWYSLDLTELEKKWATNSANYAAGFVLRKTDGGYCAVITTSYHADYQPYYTITYFNEAVGLTSGESYMIRNVATDYYLDVADSGTSDGTTVYAWPFHGAFNQQWKVVRNTGTFFNSYKLIPRCAENTILGVLASGTACIRPSTTTSTLRIVDNGDGTYRIIIGADNRVLTVSGTRAYQASYMGTDSQKWVFEKTRGRAELVGSLKNDKGANFISWADNVSKVLKGMNYDPVNTRSNVTTNDLYSALQGSSVCVFFGDGDPDFIAFFRDNGEKVLFSAMDIERLPENALANTRLVIYAGCEIGKNGLEGINLVTRTHDMGAKTVIAFKNTVYVQVMNTWLQYFFIGCENGDTIQEACNYADEKCEYFYPEDIYWKPYDTIKARTIAGSTSQQLG